MRGRWTSLAQIAEPLLTCESVLSETAFHLASSAYVLSLVDDGMVRVAFEVNRNLDSLRELAGRYMDRKPDSADLGLIRMSELFLRHTMITTGRGFPPFSKKQEGSHTPHLPEQTVTTASIAAVPTV